jgi:hypothetical protein
VAAGLANAIPDDVFEASDREVTVRGEVSVRRSIVALVDHIPFADGKGDKVKCTPRGASNRNAANSDGLELAAPLALGEGPLRIALKAMRDGRRLGVNEGLC